MTDISEFKKFMKENKLFLSYTYKKRSKYFLENKSPNMGIEINSYSLSVKDCKPVKWFYEKDKSYYKKSFEKYIKDNNFIINNPKRFGKELINNEIIKKKSVIIGTSEVLYPFIMNNFKTLSIPNDLHTEYINRYYIHCMLSDMLCGKINLFICLPTKKQLGKTNHNDHYKYIRYTTKELYTMYEYFKYLNKKKTKRRKKKAKKIKMKKYEMDACNIFTVWKLYSI